jgi:capsular exopolysaccharide synthesis family protein
MMSDSHTPPSAVASGVEFFLDGVVTATNAVPIVDCLRDANSVTGEELRLLRAKLRTLAQERGVKCIGLSSALPGEGKSTISLGLATALARDAGRRVLLIEADLRRPSISKTLGVPPAPGLAEWLNGSLDRIPLRVVQPGGFRLLVAGRAPLESPESVGSPLMAALLRSAREAFDYVLLDGPPVLAVSDMILVQDLVDGMLIVARSRQTPREAILDALGRLRSDKVLGLVLNDHREYRHSYQSYAYERYGMGERTGSSRPAPAKRR